MAATVRITFDSSRGNTLCGVLHHPADGTPRGAVVVAHGMLSSKDSAKHTRLCETAAGLGLLALRFDFAGRGESAGDPRQLTVSGEIDDLQCAVGVVTERYGGPIALVGSSLGGTVALLTAAANTPAVAALVTIAAPARLPLRPRPSWPGSEGGSRNDLIEVAPGALISTEFFADANRHDPAAAAVSITNPWRIIHGARDETVPADDAVILAAANPHAEIVIHPEAGHRFDGPGHLDWLINTVAAFISGEPSKPAEPTGQG